MSARTSDGQEVKVDASVIYSIDPQKVTQIHIEWQNRYSTDLVRPISRGIIRDTLVAIPSGPGLQFKTSGSYISDE